MEAEAVSRDIWDFMLSSLVLSPPSLDVWAQTLLEMVSLVSVCQWPSVLSPGISRR